MNKLLVRLGVFAAIFLISQEALASIPSDGVLDDVASRFLTESSAWADKITEYASWLFWTLTVISMVWTFGMMALRKADIGEFFAEFVKFTITTGFFWWLLINGPNFAMSIIDSLRTIGAEASGLPRELTPSEPINIAFDIIAKTANSYDVTSPIDNLSIFIITLAILICLGVVAANVLLVLITAWVMAYAGIFVLGFGGSRWTSDIAINYFRSVAGIALKLMTMTLVIGIAISIMDGYCADLQEGAPMRELLVIFIVSMVLLVLIHSVPNVVAGLIPGGGAAASAGSSLSAGAIAGAAVGATATVASGVATGGAALAAGAASAAGGAQAVMAAFSKASESASSGGGAADLMSAFSGGGGDGGGALAAAMGGGDGGAEAGTGDTPFAQAAGFGGGGDSGGGGESSSTTASDGEGGASMANSGGSDAGNSGGGDAKSSTKGQAAAGGGFLASAAKAGRITADAGGILAKGIGAVAKAKAGSIKDSAMERIADTTGGKIAAAIKGQGSETTNDPQDAASPTFGANSLASGETQADPESEVAAFVNRSPTE